MGTDANQNQELWLDRTAPVDRIGRLLQIFGVGVAQTRIGTRSSSSAVCGRLTTKTGLKAQSATICCPGWIWEMSMLTGPAAAIVARRAP